MPISGHCMCTSTYTFTMHDLCIVMILLPCSLELPTKEEEMCRENLKPRCKLDLAYWTALAKVRVFTPHRGRYPGKNMHMLRSSEMFLDAYCSVLMCTSPISPGNCCVAAMDQHMHT